MFILVYDLELLLKNSDEHENAKNVLTNENEFRD